MLNRVAKVCASALLIWASSALAASAQQSGCSYIVYGAVLTAAQWNNCFMQKQDALGFTPINKAGDAMAGRLATVASTINRSGLSIAPGVAPTLPLNGDIWVTASGLFVQVNGVTIGPLFGSTQKARSQTLPSDPVGTASSTGVMMGLGGSITPNLTGNVLFLLDFSVVNGTASGGCTWQIRYGTGTAPVNAAALTGTATAKNISILNNASTAALQTHGGARSYVTGLTVGTPYWFDLSLKSNGTGTCTMTNVTEIAIEE